MKGRKHSSVQFVITSSFDTTCFEIPYNKNFNENRLQQKCNCRSHHLKRKKKDSGGGGLVGRVAGDVGFKLDCILSDANSLREKKSICALEKIIETKRALASTNLLQVHLAQFSLYEMCSWKSTHRVLG